MISRQWSALCPKEKAEEYVEHLLSETFQTLKTIRGFQKASILTREEKEDIQFLIITEWNSVEDIKAFAGEEVEQAVVPEKVKQMMIHYDEKARHFEIKEEVIA
jgi:heme-degrading monooxygenase HmoA